MHGLVKRIKLDILLFHTWQGHDEMMAMAVVAVG